MHHILQTYLRRLTNLNSNNRSLFLPRLISKQFIDVQNFDFLNNFPAFKIIEWAIAGGAHDLEGIPSHKMPLCPLIDSRDASANKISYQLKMLSRTEKFIFEEQGSRDLFLGWPFVRGKFADGTPVRCPLMFFPVRLEEHQNPQFGRQWVLSMRDEVSVSLNKSFLLAYAYYNQLSLDDNLTEKNFDDFDTDSRIFRTSLYQLFKESAVELNFNQEIFVDKLQSFQEYRRDEFEQQVEEGKLKLYPEAVLGIFPQAGSYLLPDYLKLMESHVVPDIEDFFSRKKNIESKVISHLQGLNAEMQEKLRRDIDYASRVKEEQMFCPFDMDAYQEQAIRSVKKGNSLVIQGPPGTGKSQLICNLISDYMAHGKRVLLVCQKKAALDVVYRRLKEKDIHPFIGLVHDFKNDRKTVYEQISKQIDSLYDYQHKNNSLDTIFLERNFLQLSRRIEQICEELEEFRNTLFNESEAGISVKELYLTSDLNQPSVEMRQEYREFSVPDIQPFVRKLRTYSSYAERFEKESFPLYNRKPFVSYTVEDLKKMRHIIKDIPLFKSETERSVAAILQSEVEFGICENLQQRSDDMAQLIQLLSETVSFQYFVHMVSCIEKEADPLWLSNIERIIMECYHGNGPELSLPSSELGKFQMILSKLEEAKSDALSWLNWKLFSKDKEYIKQVFEANQLKPDKQGIRILTQKIDSRLNLEHNLSKLREKKWLQDVPEQESSDNYTKASLQAWFYHQKQALNATLIFRSIRNFNEYFNAKSINYDELSRRLNQLMDVLNTIPPKISEWEVYLSPAQVSNISSQTQSDMLLEVLDRDFDALCDFDTIRDRLEPHEKSVINRLLDAPGSKGEDAVEALFQNSLRLAWIDHIEIKYPVLRIVSSRQLTDLENELQQAVQQKLAISQEILLMKLRERTYYDVEYNRLNNMVTYRDLNHQINKKRKVWPLRKMLATFEHELFNLIPCWLASPETVSAIFPMEEKPFFDLVIFDEASQCFTEKGIPAMYRGQQVVIAGDSQQLSPNDLYQVRWEGEENEEVSEAVALEASSLLDLSAAYLDSVLLKGHYRSKTLDLIDFSNHHFYQGKLRMLPDFADVNRDEPAISYIKVDGSWKKQVNQEESRRVVQLVEELLKSEEPPSIGIITFNVKQQNLIQDELEQYAYEKKLSLPDDLFVKNIENVQGDERDVIIFSTAYAPNEEGKLMLQFGSLNQVKGENRLNVAITRAREKIYIISSILPAQLNTENSKNEGPKLLKKYLQYALEVSEGQHKPALPALSEHRTDWFLSRKLKDWTDQEIESYQAKRELPFSDLSVRKGEGNYIGLINTDDDIYYQSASAKDLHAYRPQLLRRKHWKFKNVYSRQYWQQQEQLKEELERFIRTDGEKS
ncbi:MAG: AAA domain-containing protein [Cyclobacteriaceae bacterium]